MMVVAALTALYAWAPGLVWVVGFTLASTTSRYFTGFFYVRQQSQPLQRISLDDETFH
jgi:carbon starvation protein CstA